MLYEIIVFVIVFLSALIASIVITNLLDDTNEE